MKFLLSAFIVLLSTALNADTSDLIFGSGVKMDKLVAVEKLLSSPDEYKEQTVTVEGKVDSVCDKKGCWMMLSSGDSRLRIKVNDGEMVFPFNAKDKTAFATGKLEALRMSKEKAIAYLSHLAEDAGESFDPSTITGETTIYQLRPSGVVIKQ